MASSSAQISASRRSAVIPSAFAPALGLPLVIWVAVVSGFLRFGGAVWDVSWHRTVGRDTFWSPPHLLLYAGVTISLIATCWALGEAASSPRLQLGPMWRMRGRVIPAAYGLAAVGAAIVLFSAPFDDLWHRIFGRDVDIWSVPHLVALFGNGVGAVGWLMAIRPWLRPKQPAWRLQPAETAYWIFLAFLLYNGWFALNWYHIIASTRDTLLYPSLAGLVLVPVLVATSLMSWRRWGATIAAAAFILLTLVPMAVLPPLGGRAPAFPPLLVIPALAIDWLAWRGRDRAGAWWRIPAIGVLSAVLFFASEWWRMQWVELPPPQTFTIEVVGPYLQAAAERWWTLPNLLTALPAVIAAHVVAAALGWWGGSHLAHSYSQEVPATDRTAAPPNHVVPSPAGADR